jgi:multiple sugar transport system permease protein
MQNTIFFVLVAVGLEFSLGFGLALLLDNDLPGMRAYRALMTLPVMMTPILMGILWTYMYKEDFGIINYFLNVIGVGKIPWQGNPLFAMLACIFVDVWQWTPFTMLVILTGLKSIPKAPIEAAMVDGASKWQIFRSISIAYLKPTIAVVLAIRIMDAFKVFDVIWQLTQGGPGQATETIAIYIYRYTFRYFHIGFGAAASYITLIIVMVVCTIIINTLHKVAE